MVPPPGLISRVDLRGENGVVTSNLGLFVCDCMRPKSEYPKVVKNGSVTVKVYRGKHHSTASGWIYIVTYIGADGRRHTPQFADENAAMEEARLKAAQIASGRVEGADMARADRDELILAREKAKSLGLPLLSALDELAKIRELTQGHSISAAEAWAARNSTRFERITVSDAITRFTAAKEKAGVDVTCSYNKIFPSLRKHAGEQLIDSLSGRQLQQWLDTRYPHPVTRNTARTRMVTLWRWARKHGYLPRDVTTEAEQTDMAQEAPSKIGVITCETYGRLLNMVATAYPEYLAALVLAGLCGLRRSEVHGQLWEDIELQRRFVRVTRAKRNTPARRLVPLAPAAVEWLMLCKNRSGKVCKNLALDRVREAARVDEYDLPENCFRHSFISHRVAMTGNVAATALEAGNSPEIIFQHYLELFTKSEGKAWFQIRRTTRPTAAEEELAKTG